jgi:hypothetical protein
MNPKTLFILLFDGGNSYTRHMKSGMAVEHGLKVIRVLVIINRMSGNDSTNGIYILFSYMY